jgi:AraC-like DNA-binding protein
MNMFTYVPKPPLSHFINEFWLWKDYTPLHPRERILPSGGAMELIVNLSDEPMILYYGKDSFQAHSFYGPIVAGPRSEYFLVDTSRPMSVLGVYFKPGGAAPILGIPLGELHNLHIPLELLWGVDAFALYERLLLCPRPQQCFKVLESVLMARLMGYDGQHAAVSYALKSIHHIPPPQQISWIVDSIGLSATHFIRVFRDEVGLTPKLYSRVARFHEALRLSVQEPSHDWADIAHQCGYYDQAHFINEFRAFTGINPSAYSPQHDEHRTNLAVTEAV